MIHVSVLLVLLAGWIPRPVVDPVQAPAEHDFHVVYGRMGVEGRVIQVRLRFFQDDLAQAVAGHVGRPTLELDVDPSTDSLVTAYLGERFDVRAGAGDEARIAQLEPLEGMIVASGEEIDGEERVWWYLVQYVADAQIERLQVDARVLLELFDDQRNILRIQHFPSERQRTFYLTEGSSVARFAV